MRRGCFFFLLQIVLGVNISTLSWQIWSNQRQGSFCQLVLLSPIYLLHCQGHCNIQDCYSRWIILTESWAAGKRKTMRPRLSTGSAESTLFKETPCRVPIGSIHLTAHTCSRRWLVEHIGVDDNSVRQGTVLSLIHQNCMAQNQRENKTQLSRHHMPYTIPAMYYQNSAVI